MIVYDRYLFRAKCVDNGEWVVGKLFDDGFENGRMFVGGFVIEEYHGTACDKWNITGMDFYEADPSTICQCTGLKDKNGKLVWENDIITISAYDYLEPTDDYTGIVRYFEKDACWCLRDFDEKDKIIPICECHGDYATKIFKLGNIFDNPELL